MAKLDEFKRLEVQLAAVHAADLASEAVAHPPRVESERPPGHRHERSRMDVGETVVVGTSRLNGGSKALIALLTAAPPNARRRAIRSK